MKRYLPGNGRRPPQRFKELPSLLIMVKNGKGKGNALVKPTPTAWPYRQAMQAVGEARQREAEAGDGDEAAAIIALISRVALTDKPKFGRAPPTSWLCVHLLTWHLPYALQQQPVKQQFAAQLRRVETAG